jgi:hypothetical protein
VSALKVDHDIVAALTRAGFSALEIGDRLGVTDRTVFRSRRHTGAKGGANVGNTTGDFVRGRIDWAARGWRAAIMAWRDGWTVAAAARRMGTAAASVTVKVHRLRALDVIPPPEAMAWRAPQPTRPKETRQYTCSACGGKGHQSPTCSLRRRAA